MFSKIALRVTCRYDSKILIFTTNYSEKQILAAFKKTCELVSYAFDEKCCSELQGSDYLESGISEVVEKHGIKFYFADLKGPLLFEEKKLVPTFEEDWGTEYSFQEGKCISAEEYSQCWLSWSKHSLPDLIWEAFIVPTPIDIGGWALE